TNGIVTPVSTDFISPFGLAVAPNGDLIVSSGGVITGGELVQKVGLNHPISIVAGEKGVPGSADGPEAEARFQGIRGIASDAAGNIYVADTGNNCIRKITPEGIVTTLAGL